MDYGTQSIGCRPDNIRSIPGVLKLIEWLCDLLATILAGAAPIVDGGSGNRGFFLFVSILALIITTTLLFMLVLNVQNAVLQNRWPLIEMIWCLFITLFYFIASIVIAVIASKAGIYGGAAFFGFAAFITYAAEAVFQFRIYRSAASANTGQQYGVQQYPPTVPPYGQPTPTYGQPAPPYGSSPTDQRH